MQEHEYLNIYQNEAKHFFYIGNHNLIMSLTKKFTKGSRGLKILDAGCGTGLLAKKLKAFGQVTGIDINSEAIKFAKKRGVDARLASVTHLPFKANTFDLIVSIDVLYHEQVTDDLQALKEFKRVLKSGGIVIVKVPAYNWIRGNHDIVVQTKKRYTARELLQMTCKVGFIPQKVSYFASFLLPIAIAKRLWETYKKPKQFHSDVVTPAQIVNNFLVLLYILEIKLLDFVNIPFGLSTFIVAKKF